MSNYAFIPLRAGGRRVGLVDGKDKERADLGGHPLMAWTIRHAIDSEVFDRVIAVTASQKHKDIALAYGVDYILDRPPYTVRDNSPDIDWVLWALKELLKDDKLPTKYSILRVTSPFRTKTDIKTASELLQDGIHSVRTVTPVEQHPGKMWVINHGTLLPLYPVGSAKNPWHSNPTQNLFPAYIQTAGMEMAWSSMTLRTKTIAGSVIKPYITNGWNALDINTKFDWYKAEQAAKHRLVSIPESLVE